MNRIINQCYNINLITNDNIKNIIIMWQENYEDSVFRQEIEKKLDDAVNYAKISPLPNGSTVEAEVYAA